MQRKVNNPAVFGIVLGLIAVLASCGGGGPTGRAPEDGRILMRNESDCTLWVSYFNEELEKKVETVVEPHETKDVSQAVLKGGTEVTLKILKGNSWFVEPKVTVDGNITVRITFCKMGGIPRIEYVITRA